MVQNTQADIVVRIATEIINSNKQVQASLKKAAQDAGQTYTKEFQRATQQAQRKLNQQQQFRFTKDIARNTLDPEVFRDAEKEYKRLSRTVGGQSVTAQQRWNSSVQIAKKRINDARKAAKAARPEFAGWAMSIMFFGMAVQRAFTGIWRNAQRTFTEVVAQTDNADNGFTRLQGSMKYLWFTVGQALEPLAYALLPIIDSVTEWVQLNPELTRQIVKWGAILGTLFMVGGGGFLALNGFKELGLIIKAMSGPVGIVAAALAIIGGIAWKAFSETPKAWEAMKSAFQSIDWEPIKTAAQDLFEILFDMDATGENLAWAMAWLGNIIAKAFQFAMGVVSSFISLLATLANAASAAWKTIRGDEDASEAVNNLKRVAQNYVNNVNSMVSSLGELGTAVITTPQQFKEETLRQQEIQELLTRTPDYSMSPYLPGKAPETTNFNNLVEELKAPFTVRIDIDGNAVGEAVFPSLLSSLNRTN